jgi:hypothetical protein
VGNGATNEVPSWAPLGLLNNRAGDVLCSLYKTNKRQNNEDDHDCPNDVDDIVHENHLSI